MKCVTTAAPNHSTVFAFIGVGLALNTFVKLFFFIPSTKLLSEFDTHIETRLLDDYSTYCAYIITGIPLPQAHMIPFFQLHNHFVVIAFYRVGFVTVFEDFTVTNRANLTVSSGLCFRVCF